MKIFLDANICLDLLDSTRATSEDSIAWYMQNKDDPSGEFYFSGDFITTFYYILTQKRKISPRDVINAIDLLCDEVSPLYLTHGDFILAKKSFFHDKICDDFEDLIVLHSALRGGCGRFVTNDKNLLSVSKFGEMRIQSPKKQGVTQ